MTTIPDFVARCDALAERLGISRATLSTRIFNDGKRLGALADGKCSITIRRLEAAAERVAALEAADAA